MRDRMWKPLCFALAVLVFSGLSVAFAQNAAEGEIRWEVQPAYQTRISFSQTALKIEDGTGAVRQMYDESHAVLIIQGRYRGHGFQAVPDQAAASEKILREQLEKLNFHVIVWRDLGAKNLKTVMDEVASKLGDRENSRLFFYYFGHGIQLGSPDSDAGTRGFLVPVDVDAPSVNPRFRESGFPFENIVATANRITLKHAFFAFEACRAGRILDSYTMLGGDSPDQPLGYVFQSDIQKSARQFLTAGNALQDVPADGIFTRVLAAALSPLGADGDGYVTGSDVIRYVTHELPKMTAAISPRSAKIPLAGSGDMVMGLVKPPKKEAKAQTGTDDRKPVIPAAPEIGPTIVRLPSQKACAESILAKKGVKDGSLGMVGIDISHFNKVTNWKAVAESGVAFVYLKASQGANLKDPDFKSNWNAAGEAGLLRGAYHFFDQRTDVSSADQVNNFLSSFEGLKFGPCDLPPALDWEWQQKDRLARMVPNNFLPGDDQVANNARSILESFERAFRMRPVVYTTKAFWDEIGRAPAGFEEYPLWIADYSMRSRAAGGAPKLPSNRTRFVFWQDQDQFAVPGISGPGVGRSVFNGTAAELKALTR